MTIQRVGGALRALGPVLLLCCTAACGPTGPAGFPSDDPADYRVDADLDYRPVISEPRWVVPAEALGEQVTCQAANNNEDIHFYRDRLYLAWRTAPSHFASELAEMIVVSSDDLGQTWQFETRIAIGTDMREPRLYDQRGQLQLIFFQAGTDMLAFEPIRMWRTVRRGPGDWTAPEVLIDAPEVPWDVKVRGGAVWMTSYQGDHYSGDPEAFIDVFLKRSTDGLSWELVGGASFVYRGGVSEVAFEFDARGDLWAVTRNEDGDESGWGSHLCTAPADHLANWDCPTQADPERYDSPELIRHGDDLYLLARRDIGGPFGADGDLAAYSLRPKTTALYRIDRQARRVVHLLDLPGCGDNAFPSARRTGPHSWLVANYTSPLDQPDISWLEGQTSPRGTQIYLIELSFVPE